MQHPSCGWHAHRRATAILRCVLTMPTRSPTSPLFPYTTLFRSRGGAMREASHSALMTSAASWIRVATAVTRSEEHTSELQSRFDLVCRLLPEKKNLLLVMQHPGVPRVAGNCWRSRNPRLAGYTA